MSNFLDDLEYCKKWELDERNKIKKELKSEKLSPDALLNFAAKAFIRGNMQNQYILSLEAENENLKIALASKGNLKIAKAVTSKVLAIHQEEVINSAICLESRRLEPILENQKKATKKITKYTSKDHSIWNEKALELDPNGEFSNNKLAIKITKSLNSKLTKSKAAKLGVVQTIRKSIPPQETRKIQK